MKIHTVLQAMQAENTAFKFVGIKFPTSSQTYHYKTILDLAVGDNVVVDTPSGMQVVRVYEVLTADQVDLSAYTYKWVVQKVDVTQYNELLDKETQLLNLIRAKQREHAAKAALNAFIGDTDEATQQQVKALVRL